MEGNPSTRRRRASEAQIIDLHFTFRPVDLHPLELKFVCDPSGYLLCVDLDLCPSGDSPQQPLSPSRGAQHPKERPGENPQKQEENQPVG
jgi:hypothetical protein